MSWTTGEAASSLFRTSPLDGIVLAAALGQGVVTATLGAVVVRSEPTAVLVVAAALVVAIGVWWGSNTFAHIHLHTPLFASKHINRAFSLYLTALLRIPQTTWRARHLAHHRGVRPSAGSLAPSAPELALIVAVAFVSAVAAPHLLLVLALGQLVGLALCFVQGHCEHHLGGGRGNGDGDGEAVDHSGRVYNLLWFNDGYHTAHHRWPGRHWSGLRRQPAGPRVHTSAWPPILRWIEHLARAANLAQAAALDWLERRVLLSSTLQRLLVASHRRAFQPLLAHVPQMSPRVGIVGGGLFPRTALMLRALRPDARLAIIDSNSEHLRQAKSWLGVDGDDVELIEGCFKLGALSDQFFDRFDVVVIPLAYRGDRDDLYRHPPAPVTLIHDWIWRRRGQDGRRVSWLLLKRVNLVLT